MDEFSKRANTYLEIYPPDLARLHLSPEVVIYWELPKSSARITTHPRGPRARLGHPFRT